MTTTPDPRPAVSVEDDGPRLHGSLCATCGHPSLWAPPRCQRCGGTVSAAVFGPVGTVWSSTVVRVPIPGRTPPYGLAYVDLDDGPRVLAHVATTGEAVERLLPGTRVRLRGSTPDGDVLVEVAG